MISNERRIINFIIRKIPILLERFHSNAIVSRNIYFSIIIENIFAFLRGKNISFSYDKEKKLITAHDKGFIRYHSEPSRCFWLYRDGIKERGRFIHKSYCINSINFSAEDIVIDCGANTGDLFIELNQCINPSNYIGIEPNPIDFKALKLNCPNTTLVNKALGQVQSKLDFYISTERGDSSLLEPKIYQEVIKVDVIRLDKLISELKLEKVKLLKLEAEGFEPEILLGAGKILNNFEYIAIDGGYERGRDEEQTFTTLTNFLIINGFEICDIYFPWFRALFKNTYEEGTNRKK